MTAVGDWLLSAAGEIVALDRENLDKSGRHPKYMLTFTVRCDRQDGVPEGAQVPADVPVRIKDIELARMTTAALGVGDRIALTARTSGAAPSTFYMTKVEVEQGAAASTTAAND